MTVQGHRIAFSRQGIIVMKVVDHLLNTHCIYRYRRFQAQKPANIAIGGPVHVNSESRQRMNCRAHKFIFVGSPVSFIVKGMGAHANIAVVGVAAMQHF